MRRVKAISHEEELSLVEHLGCARIVSRSSSWARAPFWQNQLLLELAEGPLLDRYHLTRVPSRMTTSRLRGRRRHGR